MPRRLMLLVVGFLAAIWSVQWCWVRWKLADWDARVAALVDEGLLPARNQEPSTWTAVEVERHSQWVRLERAIGEAVAPNPRIWADDERALTPSLASSPPIDLDSLADELASLDMLLSDLSGESLRDVLFGGPGSSLDPRGAGSVIGCAWALGERALRGSPVDGSDPRAFEALFDYVAALREGSTSLTLVRWRVERYALRCLRAALQVPRVNASALASSLDGRLAEMASESRYRNALRSHFAVHLDSKNRPLDGEAWALFDRGAALHQHSWLLSSFESLVRRVPTPGESPRDARGVLELPGRDESHVRGLQGRRRDYVQNGVTAIEHEYQSLRRAHRLARVALALAAHRQAQGHWPAELAALDPPPGPDPGSGEPFLYGTTGDEIWLMAPDLSHLGPAFSSAPIDDLLRWTWTR